MIVYILFEYSNVMAYKKRKTSQQARFKKVMKGCKGKKGAKFKSCIKKGLKKKR